LTFLHYIFSYGSAQEDSSDTIFEAAKVWGFDVMFLLCMWSRRF